jgi:hypothetical protein
MTIDYMNYMNEFIAAVNDDWVNKIGKGDKKWLQFSGYTPYSYVDGKFCWMNSPEGDFVKELPNLYVYFVGCKLLNHPYRASRVAEYA